MRPSVTRQLIALLALFAFSATAAETALAAACAPAGEACESAECMQMEGELEANPSSDEAEPVDPDPAPTPDGPQCPLIAAGACVTAASLPVSTSDHSFAVSSSDDGAGARPGDLLSRESHGLLRPPIL